MGLMKGILRFCPSQHGPETLILEERRIPWRAMYRSLMDSLELPSEECMRATCSRRDFLADVAGMSAAMLWRPPGARAADDIDPRVVELVAGTIGIDTHNHIDVPLTSAEVPGPDLDLAGQMKRSGLSAICATFAVDRPNLSGPGDAYDRILLANSRRPSEDRTLGKDWKLAKRKSAASGLVTNSPTVSDRFQNAMKSLDAQLARNHMQRA